MSQALVVASRDLCLNNQAMLKPKPPKVPKSPKVRKSRESTPEQLLLAANLTIALEASGAPTAAAIATRCGVSDQAVSGWKRTGKITKKNLAIVSEMTNRSITKLMTGLDPDAPLDPPSDYSDRLWVTQSEWDLLQAVKVMMTEQEKKDLQNRYSALKEQVTQSLGNISGKKI